MFRAYMSRLQVGSLRYDPCLHIACSDGSPLPSWLVRVIGEGERIQYKPEGTTVYRWPAGEPCGHYSLEVIEIVAKKRGKLHPKISEDQYCVEFGD